MPRNSEEKKKCQEKLNQMQKYLPFVDFMIDKIKKKNETSLVCQLNKFEVLRSMIAERSDHYTLDVLTKVEQIIEKLISKLGYKEDVKNSNASLKVKDINNTKPRDLGSGSRISFSASSVDSAIQAENSKSQNYSSSNVYVITKSPEMSVGVSSNEKVRNDAAKSLEEKSKYYIPKKILGTDLDKDLDGFDLTDCSNASERKTNSLLSSNSVGSEKASQDLLTSSREKLLKSLQKRLFPNRVEYTSHPFSGNKMNSSFSGETYIKSPDQDNKCENRRGSVETNERIITSNNSIKNKILEKCNPVSSKPVKSYGQLEKLRSDADSSEINLKQKLKEKFSTDICEVYRVPGKSVGGSLRFLKDSKDPKKNNLEENDLFRADLVTKINVPSRGCSSSLQQHETKDKYRQDSKSSELRIEKSSDKSSQNFSISVKSKQAFKHSKLNEFKNNKSNIPLDKKPNKYDKRDVREDKTEKEYEMNKLNDNELTEFVKENIQHLPHLAKLQPAELRKTVESTFVDSAMPSDVEIISDDSLQEFDEFLSSTNKSPNELKLTASSPTGKSKNKERHPLASLKIAEVDADSASKNIKPGADGKVVEETGDKINHSGLLPSADEEEDYAIKLIEETTLKNVPVKKRKSLLDLPIPDTTDLFDDITSIENFESSKSTKEIRDPRLKKLENEKRSNKIDPKPNPTESNQNSYPLPSFAVKPQEGFTSASLPIDNNFSETQGKEQRHDDNPVIAFLSEDPNYCNNNLSKKVKNPNLEACKSSKDPRLLAHNPPVPQSYAEYKRMKLQEQKSLVQCEAPPLVTQKFCDNNISQNSYSLNDKDSIKPGLFKSSEKRSFGQKFSNIGSANVKSSRNEKKIKPRKTFERKIQPLRENCQKEKERNERQKILEEKRGEAESEDSISPLEKLYQIENKPKTGRGYGIQNFKIPKKVKTSFEKQAAEKQPAVVVKDVEKEAAVVAKDVEKEAAVVAKDVEKQAGVVAKDVEKQAAVVAKDVKKQAAVVAEDVEKQAAAVVAKDLILFFEKEGEVKETNNVRNDCQISSFQKELDSSKANTSKDTAVEPVTVKPQEGKTEGMLMTIELEKETLEENRVGVKAVSLSSESKEDVNEKLTVIIGGENQETENTFDSQTVHDTKRIDQAQSEIGSKIDSDPEQLSVCEPIQNTDNNVEGQPDENVQSKPVEVEPVKKYEPEIVECDSSVGNSTLNGTMLAKDTNIPGEKSSVISKEEITQEYVEALIRKSFESGQGKLLLAQAKLFEELGRKLNSKKLKTIQKIINSESDSSSSSSESSSSNERKKKKSKKSKKFKKKTKKSRRLIISSSSSSSSELSSSSSEGEESGEEKNSMKKKKPDSPETQDKSDRISLEETEIKNNDLANKLKSKTKKKRFDYPGYFSRKRNKRKQQNKLIENILSEEPVNTEETCAKEQESKTKPKPKPKVKTELDKLHEDIKNMFISSGVLTATGQRMCRILRNSGGKVDSVDIVKESAKMVEEEKLKKVQTNSRNARPRNAIGQDSRSRSQSLDKYQERLNDYDQDPKLKIAPYVLLQKVDLNNFGYGVKISDDCISFSRVQGRNTALRGFKTLSRSFANEPTLKSPSKNLSKGIFLARNKRKYERLSGKVCRTVYVKKKLMDIVRNLPLKMAKIKHLQFSEKKNDDTRKKKMVPEKLDRKMARLGEGKRFRDDELMNHAFKLRKSSYRCKVCSGTFKNITEHYKTVHPEHGVLISRLCQKQAIRAKFDALKNNYEDQSASKDFVKRNTKTGPFSYYCRMCSLSGTNDVNVFFTHVTSHTGELRFQCPSEGCAVQTANGEEIKFHILTKHPKSRYDLYNQIIELYPSPIEGCQLFGFLCSKCNFVQLSRSNMDAHVSKQHSSDNIKIFKINMSSDMSNRSKIKRAVMKNNTRNPEQLLRLKANEKKNEELAEPVITSLNNANSQTDTDIFTLEEQKSEEEENNGKDVASITRTVPDKSELKVMDTDVNTQVSETEEAVPNETTFLEELKEVSVAPDVEENIAVESFGSKRRIIETLEVGPLKSLLLENSEMYFKCGIENCGIIRKSFEKFEGHLTFKHCRKKWNGICQICSVKVPKDLLSALKHLKFHLIKSKSVESAEKLKSNDLELQSEKVVEKTLVHSEEGMLDEREIKDTENVGKPYPTKPLLKVRNLLGDRLSTPKELVQQNEIITIPEEEAGTTSLMDKMFTIENVRSLKSDVVPDATDNNQEPVCVVTDQHPGGSQAGPGKVILVRSCPSRKIAIRPENNPASLDIGQFNFVQTPAPTHPVMLGPVPAATPLHLFSSLQPVCQNSMIAIKPVMVTNGAVPNSATFKSNSNMMPVIRPESTSASILPSSATSETSETTQKPTPKEATNKSLLIRSKHPLEVTVSMPPSEPESPSAGPRTFLENSNSEDQEDKELINPLRIFTSIGSKVVKDAAIYKQMLTKTKLCHLFKCMAVECSFTCNSENIFTRHIGLHEAQRRLKKKQGLKESFPQSKKLTKTFQWQQCAYCCQILSQGDNALSRHIILEHGHCTYQCAYCFYRAVSQSYVEIHQNLVHNQILMLNSRVIYKCKPLPACVSRPSALEKRGKRQSVRPYICDQCGKNFYVIQEFLMHLTTEHQTVTAYTCHICKNLSFKANRLINHYKLHSYCTYQCAYCLHGTETELEMVFHLCNFHFSQPAVMYLRALPEGVESKGITQLESMKVVVYENDSLNEDCITEVDADTEEESTYDPLKESLDFSEIVAELGINSDDQLECEVTPLLKELASLSDYSTKDVTVKTLLPNAQFSSENDNSNEGCSVLISSGVSVASTQNDDKEMSIPLGQLPLEALNIKHVQHSSPKTVEPPQKSPNLNESIISHKAQETSQSFVNTEEEKTFEPPPTPCVHNLPQVLLTRTLGPKNVYPSKRLVAAKKPSENSCQIEEKVLVENICAASCETENTEGVQTSHSPENKLNNFSNEQNVIKASAEKDFTSEENMQPLITSVVSLSESAFDDKKNTDSPSTVGEDISVSKIVINIHSNVHSRVPVKNKARDDENLQIDDSSQSLDTNPELVIDETSIDKNSGEEEIYPDLKSPDVVIIEEGNSAKDIETVTLDSDDEKDAQNVKSEVEESSNTTEEKPNSNGEIRKEMEILRHQMTNETDSLLFDGSKEIKLLPDVTITFTKNQQDDQPKDAISPAEEVGLNEKINSETTATQEIKPKINDKAKKNNSDQESIKQRTRFGSRDKRKECTEEKNEEESKKEESNKNKKVRKELCGLLGKELYICGNEQCTFAAENNSLLKDHLFVCDFSRLSSVLMCPHCSKHLKHFGPYLEHLKYHGEKKYHCGLCSFSSAGQSSVPRHLKQKHKCHITKSVPKEPPQEDHIVFYPKNYKIDKIDFEENGYSPGDENKLPLQSVYQVNVKCAKCPYFTKVRSNMVRHLKIHVKSAETEGVIVPSTAPTNPVPCLEAKEKMFDKMTNLAASSQLAHAEKEKLTALPPELEAQFPQYVAEQLRFKCCLPDCNYITVDDRMLKHHIKALHNEVTHYSCPHCRSTVHLDMRKVPLEKIGHHLKFHDSKLYKCGQCIYIHYQKNLVEKHSCEKHPDRRCFVQMVRDSGIASEEEHSGSELETVVWSCGRCHVFQCVSKSKLRDHLFNEHKIRYSYQCKYCSVTGNGFKMFTNHFASKHPGEEVAFTPLFYEQKVPYKKLGSLSGNLSGADSSNEHFDTTPLWQRGAPRVRHIRGILIEEEEVRSKKIKRWSVEEAETTEPVPPKHKAFYCPLCTDKKKVFFTKSEDYFRTHLYQELNYQQFACILCGKMFVNKKDFEKHHARMHPDKPPEMNQTKEDGEIIFWVDKVIAKQRQQINENKRKLSNLEFDEGSPSPKKKKEES